MYTQYAKIVKRRCTGTKKASDFSEASERKTRLEPAADAAASSRYINTSPALLKEGARGRSSEPIYEKGSRNIRNPFERKTRLELATPTLARSCSTN